MSADPTSIIAAHGVEPTYSVREASFIATKTERSWIVSGMRPMPASAAIANVSNSLGSCLGPTVRPKGRPR